MFAPQFWFAIYNRWSAQTFFDDWVMAAFNVVILSLPPLSLAIFEKDLHEEVIFKYPETYRELQRGLYFTPKTVTRWMISATCHSVVIYFSIFFIADVIRYDGYNEDLLIISTIAASTGVFAIVGKAAVVTHHWVWPCHVAYWLSYIALFGLLLIESSLLGLFPNFYQVMNITMSLGYYWFMIVIVFAICIIPEFALEYIQRSLFPYDWQIVQEKFMEIVSDNNADEFLPDETKDPNPNSEASALTPRDRRSSPVDLNKAETEDDEPVEYDPTMSIPLEDKGKGKMHLDSSDDSSMEDSVNVTHTDDSDNH